VLARLIYLASQAAAQQFFTLRLLGGADSCEAIFVGVLGRRWLLHELSLIFTA
jgi:hypothetical protein